jgi:hypothetical protein
MGFNFTAACQSEPVRRFRDRLALSFHQGPLKPYFPTGSGAAPAQARPIAASASEAAVCRDPDPRSNPTRGSACPHATKAAAAAGEPAALGGGGDRGVRPAEVAAGPSLVQGGAWRRDRPGRASGRWLADSDWTSSSGAVSSRKPSRDSRPGGDHY